MNVVARVAKTKRVEVLLTPGNARGTNFKDWLPEEVKRTTTYLSMEKGKKGVR